ncbi:MAG: hypothetical protein R2703_07785 [Micropruina glycogenica]|jgi:putative intracellular protease/amidase
MTTRVGIIAFDDAEVLDVMGPFEVFAVAGRLSSPSAFDVAVVSAGESERSPCGTAWPSPPTRRWPASANST